MHLDEFEKLVRKRRAVRHFRTDPIADNEIKRLLDIAHWSPSGYNLQPTHFFVVTENEIKEKLVEACFNQKQVLYAPATVVFTGDRKVVENQFKKTVSLDKEANAINEKYEQILNSFVPLAFSHKPMGMGWVWKACLLPFVRFFRPVPSMPAVHKRYWLTKQVMLSAMIFMLAAEAAGYATVPMEGFDESRVRKILNIPSTHIIPVLIPVGYSADGELKKTRLPIDDLVHFNQW